jgi:hypothetical protein
MKQIVLPILAVLSVTLTCPRAGATRDDASQATSGKENRRPTAMLVVDPGRGRQRLAPVMLQVLRQELEQGVEGGRSYAVVFEAAQSEAFKQLGLKPPVREKDMLRAGRHLGVDFAIRVELVNFRSFIASGKVKHPPAFHAEVRSKCFEVSTGLLVNGECSVAAAHPPREGPYERSVLEEEAVTRGCRMSARPLSWYTLPQGQIVWDESGWCLDKGSRDGVPEGLRMRVLRDCKVIDEAVVTDAAAHRARLKFVRSRDIRTGDSVQAVFVMPDFSRSICVARPQPSLKAD